MTYFYKCRNGCGYSHDWETERNDHEHLYCPANQLVTEAREWLRDLDWADDDAEEQIAEASDAYILLQIRRHYAGGIQGFIRDIA